MENELDYLDLDDDDLSSGQQDSTSNTPDTSQDGDLTTDVDEPGATDDKDDIVTTGNQGEDDLLTTFLKSKGVKDPKAIKQEDDNGEIKEVDFYSLSPEEQLNILKSSDLDNNYGLEPEETQFINYLRDNNITANDYIEYAKQQAVNDYIESNNQPQYSIDALSDEELYLLDLKYNLKDLTEEEAAQYLDHEKANTDLWNKKIAALRDNYKAKEQERLDEDNLIEQQEAEQRQQEFTDSMINAIGNLQSIESFDLENEDKDRIAEFILGKDATGTNYLYRALQDPETVAKMAWFLLDGEESIRSLNDYWTNIVKQRSKSKYEEGYKDGSSGSKSKVTVTKAPTKKAGVKNSNVISLDNGFAPQIDLD